MPDFFQLLVLSLLQGVTEFLPVSSSGHLVLLPFITGWADQGRGLDVAAHLGTLAAVLIWWRADIILMLRGLLSFGRKHAEGWLLFWQLVLASLPVILAGLLVHIWDLISCAWLSLLRWPIWSLPAGSGGRINSLSRHRMPSQPGQPASWRAVLLIGLAQILALIPGASRSGVTISMARQLGWPRAAAARFSMLLSIPVIAGAGCLSLLNLAGQQGATSLTAALITTLLSFVFALLSIRWLMGWLARADFPVFVIYRLVLGVLLLGFLAFLRIFLVALPAGLGPKTPAWPERGQIGMDMRLNRLRLNTQIGQTRQLAGDQIIQLQQFQLIRGQRRVRQAAGQRGWQLHGKKWHRQREPPPRRRLQNKTHQIGKTVILWPAQLINFAGTPCIGQAAQNRLCDIADKDRLHPVNPAAYQRQGRGQHRHATEAVEKAISRSKDYGRAQNNAVRGGFSQACFPCCA